MSALIKIESMESCPEDGIPCECKAVNLRIVAPTTEDGIPCAVNLRIPTEITDIVADTVKTVKTWKTYFARLFPMLSCTSEAAVAVQ